MFELSDDEREIVSVVADFVDSEVRPVARDLVKAQVSGGFHGQPKINYQLIFPTP
ncbi:MAG TPA: hypothetical protein VHW74_03450 [Mycobacteriales bacterium]|nr:hypothetical protein [Mycobacteriales bacterium]